MPPTAETPRARYRAQTREEIKDAALRQLAEGGLSAIALTRIAKELGLSGPALYRYFAGRDDLVNALIRDAYDDLATAIEQAAPPPGESTSGRSRPGGSAPGRSAVGGSAVGGSAVGGSAPSRSAPTGSARSRLGVLSEAFRGWATAVPHRYLLIAGAPLPGYEAPPDTVERARAALGPFLPVFAAGEPGPTIRPVAKQLTSWVRDDEQVRTWVTGYLGGKPSVTTCGTALAGAILTWTRMHGVVSLEVEGQFAGMGFEPPALLVAEMANLADTFSLD